MDQVCLIQQAEGVQQLLREDTDKSSTQSAELVLFDQLVQVDAEKLKGKTQMLPVDEGILQPQKVVIVILIVLAVEL